jgi:hypothetical protein
MSISITFSPISSRVSIGVLSQLLLRVLSYFYPSPSAPRHVPVYLELLYRCPQYRSFLLGIHFRTWHSSRVLATHAVNCSNRRKVFSFSSGQVRRIGETLRGLSLQVNENCLWRMVQLKRRLFDYCTHCVTSLLLGRPPHKFAAGVCSNISVENASESGGRPNKSYKPPVTPSG